jgi:hypothetical protein
VVDLRVHESLNVSYDHALNLTRRRFELRPAIEPTDMRRHEIALDTPGVVKTSDDRHPRRVDPQLFLSLSECRRG